MWEDYESEEEMAQAARDLLEEYLKVDLEVINMTGSESDGSCHINGHLILNLEVKLIQDQDAILPWKIWHIISNNCQM